MHKIESKEENMTHKIVWDYCYYSLPVFPPALADGLSMEFKQ